MEEIPSQRIPNVFLFTHLQFFLRCSGYTNTLTPIRTSPVVLAADRLTSKTLSRIFLSQRSVPCFFLISGPVCIQWLLISGRSLKELGGSRPYPTTSIGIALRGLQFQHPTLNLSSVPIISKFKFTLLPNLSSLSLCGLCFWMCFLVNLLNSNVSIAECVS